MGFAVAGRLVERLAGTSFEQAFQDRIAKPLGMTHTRFDGTRRPYSRNPSPAASATSTVDDYARFLRMLAAGGKFDGKQVLSPSSVAEIEKDQVRGLDTRADDAVQITGIPTYGLGVWRDEVAADDSIEVVSGSGALGFYPWIDRVHGNYGIVGGRRRAPRRRTRGARFATHRPHVVDRLFLKRRRLRHRVRRRGECCA